PNRDRAGDERQLQYAVVQSQPLDPADRRCRGVRRDRDRRLGSVDLPANFPRRVAAFAFDLDRTLIAEDGVLRPRTRAALVAVREAGSHVIVVTGRMFRAVRPYLTGEEPVVCYQGAVVADPVSAAFIL